MTRIAALAPLALALLLAGAAHAQTAPTPAAKPCAVSAQSRTGGVIQIVASVPGQATTGPQLVWQPVASGPGVILWVTYAASAIAHMDDPSGVMIRFKIPANVNMDEMAVSVATRNGRTWRFTGKTIVADGGNMAHVAFGTDWPYGRGLIAAVADAQPLAVAIQQNETTLATDSFVLSNIDARDTLLAQVRTKFQALGSAACPAGVAP
jgi:hypothetical protein